MEFFKLAGALMEHLIGGSALIRRLWYVNSDKKICIFVTLFIWANVPNVLSEIINSMKYSISAPAE